MPTFYYSDKILLIVITYVNHSKNIHKFSLVKFLLSLRASASAFAPSSPILLPPKIMKKEKNNRLILAIININKNFVWIIKIILQINIKTL